MNLLQLANRNLSVDLRAFDAGEAEHLLDRAQVGSAFEHERGLRVAEEMTASSLSNIGASDVLPSEIGEVEAQKKCRNAVLGLGRVLRWSEQWLHETLSLFTKYQLKRLMPIEKSTGRPAP